MRGPADRAAPGRAAAARAGDGGGPVPARSQAGAGVEALFLRSLAEGDFEPVDLTAEDYARAADLIERYADLPLGTTDAAVVAVAERLGITEVATLDQRPFSVVRPRHVEAFTLLP